jgi:hypothetical protein
MKPSVAESVTKMVQWGIVALSGALPVGAARAQAPGTRPVAPAGLAVSAHAEDTARTTAAARGKPCVTPR